MNKLGKFAVAVLLLLVSGQWTFARAGEPHAHDGFFLRFAPGFGSGSAKVEEAGNKLEFSGALSDVDLAIGGRIGKNLILHGTLFGWTMSSPDADLTIAGFGSGSGEVSGTLTMGAFGAGLTYYVMPANLYFTGSIGMGTLTSDLEDPFKGDSDSGVAFTLGLGKEWWVGDAWGLGIGGGLNYCSLPDKDIVGSSENWSGLSYTVRASLTYN